MGLPRKPGVGRGEGPVPALLASPSRRRSSSRASSGSTPAVSYVGTSNADRFSKVQFGLFGGTSLRGFSSGSLRAEEAFTAKLAYGVVVGKLFRLQALYDHAVVNDPANGLDWTNFGGAGVSGQFSGPWSTLVQLEAGLPVVGRSHGQKGFVLYLVFLRSF